jgi:hypothetical protein
MKTHEASKHPEGLPTAAEDTLKARTKNGSVVPCGYLVAKALNTGGVSGRHDRVATRAP